jgi:Tol biopolymer transport system component
MLFAFDLQTGSETVLYRAPERSYMVSVALTPDGRKLAIVVSVLNNSARELIILNSDGSQQRTLLRTSTEDPGALVAGPSALSWSPDGNHLYLVRQASTKGMDEIHRIAPETETKSKATGIIAKRITFMNLDPSGTKVAFSAGGVVDSELWSLDNAMATLKAAR